MTQQLKPLELAIPHATQLTPVWCWVAVAHMVIAYFKGAAATPPQKDIARMALGEPRGPAWEHSIPSTAMVPNSADFIALIVRVLARRASAWYPPCSAEDLYANLYFGNPVILQLRTSGPYSHVVVVSGMRPAGESGQFDIRINDPAPNMSGPFWVPYGAILPAILQHMIIYRDIRS